MTESACTKSFVDDHDNNIIYLDIFLQLHGKADHVLLCIFSYLHHRDIFSAELVCKSWNDMINSLPIWEHYVKSKIHLFPLWNRIYKLLKSDESLFPEECSLTYRQIPQAIYETCKRLESNWENCFPATDKTFECENVDKSAPKHCQIDDMYIALKNKEGLLKVWSRRTGLLEHEIKCSPEPLNTHGTYAIGDKLVIYSGLDGIIHVWDLTTSSIVFEIEELNGAKIISLNFNPVAGALMACYFDKMPGSSLAVWKVKKNKRGQFFLKYRRRLSNLEILRILGFATRTFGILCAIPDDQNFHQVQIFKHDQLSCELLCVIDLKEKYRLDWADGFLVIAHRFKINVYDVSTGVCVNILEHLNGDDGSERMNPFLGKDNQVSVCSTKVITSGWYGRRYVGSLWHYDIATGYFEPVLKNSEIEETSCVRRMVHDMEILKMNEIQGVYMCVNDANPENLSCEFNLVEIYPACSNCGLYRRGMGTDSKGRPFVGGFYEFQYCSVSCFETCSDLFAYKEMCESDSE